MIFNNFRLCKRFLYIRKLVKYFPWEPSTSFLSKILGSLLCISSISSCELVKFFLDADSLCLPHFFYSILITSCFHIIRVMTHTRIPPVQFFPITGNRLPPWVKRRGYFLPHQLLICCLIKYSENSLCAQVTVSRCSRQQTSLKELEEVILSSVIHFH